jgi:hypothetical protein
MELWLLEAVRAWLASVVSSLEAALPFIAAAMDSPVVSTWAPFPCFYCCLLSTTRPGYQLRGRSRGWQYRPSQQNDKLGPLLSIERWF